MCHSHLPGRTRAPGAPARGHPAQAQGTREGAGPARGAVAARPHGRSLPSRLLRGPGRAGPCAHPHPRRRRHYRVEVEHGAHQDEEESDGKDGEVQHGRAGPGRRERRLGPTPRAAGGAGRGGPGRAGLGTVTGRYGEPSAAAAGLQLHPARRGLPGPLPAAHQELPRGVSAAPGAAGARPRALPRLQAFSPFSSPRKVKRVLFVPYALHDRDAYARTAREKFESLGKAGPPRAPSPCGSRCGTVAFWHERAAGRAPADRWCKKGLRR